MSSGMGGIGIDAACFSFQRPDHGRPSHEQTPSPSGFNLPLHTLTPHLHLLLSKSSIILRIISRAILEDLKHCCTRDEKPSSHVYRNILY